VWTRIWIGHLVGGQELVPAMVRVGGFVVWGAEIRVHAVAGTADQATVEAVTPDAWFATAFDSNRLITKPGNPWLLLRPPFVGEQRIGHAVEPPEVAVECISHGAGLAPHAEPLHHGN
jgi:hypothetical protein